MSDAIVRLKVESQEYDQKLKRATEGLTRYADECRKVGGTLEVVEQETLDYVRALGKMDTVAKTTNGSLSEMKKAYTELSMQYRKMTDEEKKGEYGQALRQSLDQLRGRIKDTEGDLKDINRELTGGNGLSGALDQVAGKFGLSIKQLTGWGAALGASKVALDVAKDAFFQSETNIDEWGRTLKGAEGAYQVFLDTLNNGNWSNFFQNLETAIRGGRDLYDALDRLGSIKSNNAAAIAIVQQQIAQLRLAKQQGKDVDDQLKAATARLAALQKQSIQAGKAAGNQTAFNVIRNGVNSIGGARVNDATIKLAVSQLMTGGQAQFDKFRNNYQTLQQRGLVTRTQMLPDSHGGTYMRKYTEFDINALTREEQKQYAIAKAITEGETRIQTGISAFAQAVTEGTASAREEFKGNRYVLQGARGGGGGNSGRGGGGKAVVVTDPYAGMFQGGPALTSGLAVGMISGNPRESMRMGWGLDYWTRQRYNQANEKAMHKGGGNKEQGEYKSFSNEMANITQGVSGIVSGIEQLGIDIPEGLKSVLGGIQAVAGILTGISALVTIITAIQGTKAVPVIGWMLARGGVVHAAGGYSVPGNNYSGDMVPAMLNSGELVLNKAQQGNLASQLSGNGLQNLHLEASVHGEQIVLAVNNTMKRKNKGELATFR